MLALPEGLSEDGQRRSLALIQGTGSEYDDRGLTSSGRTRAGGRDSYALMIRGPRNKIERKALLEIDKIKKGRDTKLEQ